MSGTSLDGLDICYCNFEFSKDKKWRFEIHNASTISYPIELEKKLANAKNISGLNLMLLNNELGDFIGNSINQFIDNNLINKDQIDCISSHGHTVFHQPEINLTMQIGNGANISTVTKLPVICDFRTSDISLGGQGAPLVPIGDQLLFSEYDCCINLGGIANVSFKDNNIAFDICPANIILNKLSQELGFNFDNNGLLAMSGKVNKELLKHIDTLDYYKKAYPKSLGIEEIENTFIPIINSYNIPTQDKLRTFVEHISLQISSSISKNHQKTLFTGGGTLNTFLVNRIKSHTTSEVIIPNSVIIDFKEALIFAFLGVLRLQQIPNCLSSVTGAKQNNIGGCIYQAFQ